MRTAIFMTIVASLAAPAWAQAPENPATVQIGMFGVRPDGSLGGYAVVTAEKVSQSFSGFVWTGSGGCSRGAADLLPGERREPPDDATDAWEVRGRVLSIAAEHAAVQLEWRRLRAAGATKDAAWSSQEVGMPLNQFIPLDANVPATNQNCAQGSTFGTRFASPPTPVAAGPRGGGSGSGGGSASSGSGTGGAVRVRTVPPYTAELWLVQSAPGKPDTVVPTTVRVENGSGTFSFPPVRFAAGGGTFTVTVKGRLRLVPGDAAPRMYMFWGERSVTFTQDNRPARDPAEPTEGVASVSSRTMPGPDDVVAFEMPPLKAAGAPSVPDKFAVRLRLRPVEAGN